MATDEKYVAFLDAKDDSQKAADAKNAGDAKAKADKVAKAVATSRALAETSWAEYEKADFTFEKLPTSSLEVKKVLAILRHKLGSKDKLPSLKPALLEILKTKLSDSHIVGAFRAGVAARSARSARTTKVSGAPARLS